MIDDNEEEKLFQELKKLADEIKFNFGANTVLLMIERVSQDGEFSEHKVVSGSTLAAGGLARNFVIRQEEIERRRFEE